MKLLDTIAATLVEGRNVLDAASPTDLPDEFVNVFLVRNSLHHYVVNELSDDNNTDDPNET